MTDLSTREARERARDRSEAYRDRRRNGRVLVTLEIGSHHIAAMERLALLGIGDRNKASIASAVGRFLETAPYVCALGDAMWPEPETDKAG
jgi:hypothetical protein